MAKRKTKNYINNADFFAAMVEYKSQVRQSIADDAEAPPVSMYIGQCISQIANRLASKPNFHNYPFKEEMIGDGIENCLMYINNFDPEKTNNPFGYFTRIIWCAFIRRIDKEKKYLYTKYKATAHMEVFNLVSDTHYDDQANYSDHYKASDSAAQFRDEFITAFEEAKNKRKK